MRGGCGPQGLLNRARTALLLWLDGAGQALCLHKIVIYCVYDPSIGSTALQCILLNGCAFLGSLAAFRLVLAPVVGALLAGRTLRGWAGPAASAAALQAFETAYHLLWLLPAYLVSLTVNGLWCSEIAKKAQAVHAARRRGGRPGEAVREGGGLRAPPPQAAAVAFGEQVYRVLVVTVFLAQVLAARHIPVVGRAAEAAMLSWAYALYTFDYRWALLGVPFGTRLAFFERHWAFLGGFGSVCAAMSLALPSYTGAIAVAVVCPLIVTLACGDVNPSHRAVAVSERYRGTPPGSLRVFWLSEKIVIGLLQHAASGLPLLRLVGFK